ncbi:MAG: (Fe-S)-binding protein [Gemmatimonadota bacterium]|nr:(Fe-S)-binding protein [Gemmatimonadota bacterium]
MRVALFATCLADRFFADACADSVRVLERFGVEVDVPEGQTCCGQPAYNTGHREEAARMARQTARTFADADYVVLPSGSCAGMIRSFYPGLLDTPGAEDPGARTPAAVARSRASPLSARAYELAEFLVRVLEVLTPAPDGTHVPLGTGLAGRRIAYHHGCHALRELGVRDEPLALLRACGAEVVAWDGDIECCGFGGLFSTKFPAVSAGMADRKLDALSPGVDAVASADGGCLLQLAGRARHRSAGAQPPFVHLATLLREGIGA